MKKKELKVTHRVHVFYSGRVQGWASATRLERLALELGLLGFVKNLSNGRVELVCEGQQETIERLLQLIQESRLGTHITKADSNWEKATQTFRDFTVEFYL